MTTDTDRPLAPAAPAPAVLATARTLVEPELVRLVDRLDPLDREVARYHLGWIDAHGEPTQAGGGKVLRAALTLLSARVVTGGAVPPAAVTAAAAVELVHNFSLLHDDVMDGDTERRHRPTAWTVYGTSPAMLSGDGLLAVAAEALLETGTPGAAGATRSLLTATRRLVAGQSADLQFERRDDVALAECLQMAADKTGALLACAAGIGAATVGGDPELVAALTAFGAETGLAFQLVDDLLGLWGDPDVTGKPVLSDIRSRKKSVPVVHALASGTDAGATLARLYAHPDPLTEDQLGQAADAVAAAGSRAWTEAECDRLHGLAAGHLATVRAAVTSGAGAGSGAADAVDELAELAAFVVDRHS